MICTTSGISIIGKNKPEELKKAGTQCLYHLPKTTLEEELYKKLYDDYLSLGNFTELILYIYITDNIDKKILDVFKFDFGIKKII